MAATKKIVPKKLSLGQQIEQSAGQLIGLLDQFKSEVGASDGLKVIPQSFLIGGAAVRALNGLTKAVWDDVLRPRLLKQRDDGGTYEAGRIVVVYNDADSRVSWKDEAIRLAREAQGASFDEKRYCKDVSDRYKGGAKVTSVSLEEPAATAG